MEYISKEKVEQYELFEPMLKVLTHDMVLLSNKKPNDPLNAYKVKILNRVLEPLKNLLAEEDTHMFLDVLDTEALPTNSDVVLTISQFNSAMESFHEKYYTRDSGAWQWNIK